MLIAGLFLFSFSHCQICIQIVGAGTVCDTDNRFTDEAAKIICMEMGYQCAENWKLGFSVLSNFYLTYQSQFYLMHILSENSKTTYLSELSNSETTSANLPALIDNVECTNTSLPFRNCRYDRIDTCNRKISLKCSK